MTHFGIKIGTHFVIDTDPFCNKGLKAGNLIYFSGKRFAFCTKLSYVNQFRFSIQPVLYDCYIVYKNLDLNVNYECGKFHQ